MKIIQNIYKTVLEMGNFKTFIRIIQKAGLTQNLTDGNQITIFAPNDAAFAKFPTEKIESLLNDKDRLLTVIKAHILAKKVMSPSLINMKKIKTINGKELIISTTKGLRINDANIIKSDVECTNGIIHALDSVLLLK
ncbi:hypothetical protein AYK20_06475 [Thermoplasmatales archaeon SG8-52-1]|nr:MAG: hypothetical protein AYK20_06475 [Thermoplasmatales archaeon SG8-52-1]